MGNLQNYLKSGGFREYLYSHIGNRVIINGLRCRIIVDKSDKNGHHAGLPNFSNTSDVYVLLGPGDRPRQIRVYKDRNSYVDFDWGHPHTNKKTDGQHFEKGVVHVQRYEGAPHVSHARYMNDSEIAKYGPIILHYAPWAVLRP